MKTQMGKIQFHIQSNNYGDPSQDITITINAINDAPTGISSTTIANEDEILTIDILNEATDPDYDI